MCGITGFIDFSRSLSADSLVAVGRRMTETLIHRGPDDDGIWIDAGTGVTLGHRRLAIVDLSPQGHQPMISASGRFVLVFNGEIYNHRALRRELETHPHPVPLLRPKASAGKLLLEGEGALTRQGRWRGHSDTEVMLAACEAWGVEAAVKRFVGMFAFALWDRRERAIHLVRDRFGEKPLYFGWQGDSFLFGSELKALRAHPSWRGEIHRDALTLFLRYGYLPAPHSIYRGIQSLEPGTILSLRLDSAAKSKGDIPAPLCYWSASEAAVRGVSDPFTGSEGEAVDGLDRVLRQAVGQQMVADVPLGAFLSGGVDSSTIVALMQAQSDRPVKTFTIGFNETDYNEAVYARAVARHLGTDHTELYVSAKDALDIIPKLPTLYDEPFGDVSQLPTHLISQLTRRHVTVSLSGDGGDELFGGYNRYLWAPAIWEKIGSLPLDARSRSAGVIKRFSPAGWDACYRMLGPLLPRKLRQRNPGGKLHKIADVLDATSPLQVYGRLVSQWHEPSAVVPGSVEPVCAWQQGVLHPQLGDFRHLMMYLDTVGYLPGDILVKVDRAGMGVSLESRIPFLDHRVFEYAWRLPVSMKIRDGEGKWLLRQLLYRYVPRELVERPKAGFAVPLGRWLRRELREWAEGLLDERKLATAGFLEPAPIRQMWEEHLSGRYDRQYPLWNVLMFQAWLEENRG